MPSADDFGIPFDGSTDVRAALQTAINSQPSGTNFTLHPDGLYLVGPITPIQITAPGVTVDGLGASIFRNQRRVTDTSGEDIIQVRVDGITIRNLRVVGFRKDTYLGSTLTPVVGSPTIVGSTIELSTQDDEVRLPLVGLDQVGSPKVSTNFETPFYFRQVDGLCKFEASMASTGGSGPALFCIYDDDTNTLLHSQSFDPTGGAPQTYTITFDPTPTHLGKRFRITIKKAVAGGTLTVHSITPYGEVGFRRGDTPWFNGGNEFSDAIQVGTVDPNLTVSGTLIEDCEIEGPDGDGINCAKKDASTIIRRITVRGNGRQSYTVHRSTNLLMEDLVGRESGRSGIDLEPNLSTHLMTNLLIRRCEFINIRNAAVAARHWAKIVDATISDFTTTNCGMGPIYGGGRPMTITNWVHTNTYRTDADRVANGSYAGADVVFAGIGMEVTDFTTELGFRLPDLTNNYNAGSGIVTYHPSGIHVHDAVVTAPTADPFIIIDVADSTVDLASGGGTGITAPTWDDTRFNWDSDEITWDGLFLGTAPAFQSDAFQFDAFQTAAVVTVFATQTMPVFSQASAAFVGHIVAVEQELAAFTQAATVSLQAPLFVTQSLPAFSQAIAGNLTIRGTIGHRVKTFQDDAFQLDAFQTADNAAEELPTFTQSLSGAVVPHGSTIGAITQVVGGFTQSAQGALEVSGLISQTITAFTQAAIADVPPEGTIAQTVPAFTQAAGIVISVVGTAVIVQTLPAFIQSLDSSLIRWPEWETSSGSEWLVTDGEEWLVRQ